MNLAPRVRFRGWILLNAEAALVCAGHDHATALPLVSPSLFRRKSERRVVTVLARKQRRQSCRRTGVRTRQAERWVAAGHQRPVCAKRPLLCRRACAWLHVERWGRRRMRTVRSCSENLPLEQLRRCHTLRSRRGQAHAVAGIVVLHRASSGRPHLLSGGGVPSDPSGGSVIQAVPDPWSRSDRMW